jgi:hypothetical protein
MKEMPMTQDECDACYCLAIKRKYKARRTTDVSAKERIYTYVRLRLDDALENLNNEENMFEGWSDARKRVYSQIETKPNSYYYRFNAPGEKQANGAWTDAEKELFHKRLAEVGADGQWGIFSMTIPGRVGYQV